MNQKDEKNATSLHFACTKGIAELVKSLLALGANPNVADAGVWRDGSETEGRVTGSKEEKEKVERREVEREGE